MTDADEPSLDELLALLEDHYSRSILEQTRTDPLSPSELADRCDASLSTICRRLDDLEAAGLVTGQTRVRDDGNHDTVYSASLESLSIDLNEAGFDFELRRREEDPVDRLHRLWGDL